MAMSARISF